MSKSSHINNYSDVAAVLDACLRNGGEGTWTVSTPAEAIIFRARAYQLRKLLREAARPLVPVGIEPTTPYDHLILTIAKGACDVKISTRKAVGVLTTQDGTRIEVERARDVQRDPLQDEVEELLKDLG